MRLEKLEIHGFKSFKNKTVLEFPDQFTAIVGPNGSGKSNIVDAICFVLGKSRGLRVSNLKELINNGGVEGSEGSFAKVTLHIEDSEKNKKKISREVNQEGQSIYRIDAKRSSRQEVLDIVGDNEYNIILQSDVTKVIEMQPRERRQIIDDLCGIGEYDKKKNKALKELEKVEDHISDTHLVLGEKETYLAQLGREKEDAIRCRDIKEELAKCTASIIYNQLESQQKKLEEICGLIGSLEEEKESRGSEIDEIKSQVAEKNKELKDINEDILSLEKEKGLVRLPEIKGELIRIQDRSKALTAGLEDNKKKIQDKKDKKQKLVENISSFEAKLRAVNEKLDFMAEKIKEEQKKFKGSGIEEEIDAMKTRIFDVKAKIAAIRESEELSNKRIEEFLGQKEDMKARIKELQARNKELDGHVKERNKQHKGDFEEYAVLKKELPKTTDRLDGVKSVLEGLKVEHARKKAEIETVEKNSGGLKGALRAINKLKEVIPGVHGPVFQLGTVLNSEYEKAMNISAGGRMYNVVVDNEDTAAKCIKYLREKQVGRATFLPLNKIRFRKIDRAPKGSIGFARDFITTNKEYQAAFDYVFGNTVLVRDLESAKDIGVGKARMVTLEGDLLTESGAMTGGYAKKVEVGFSRVDELEKELKMLDQRIIDLEGEKQELQLKKEKLESKLEGLEAPVANGRTDVEKIILEKESMKEREDDLKYRIEETEHLIKTIKENIAKDKITVKEFEKDIKNEEKQLSVLLKKKQDSNLDRLEKLKDEYRDLEVEQKTLEEKKSLAIDQSREVDEEVATLVGEKEGMEKETLELKDSRDRVEKEIASLEKENAELVRRIDSMLSKRSEIEDELTSLGGRAGETDRKYDEASDNLGKQMVRKATAETRIQDLKDEFLPYTETEILDLGVRELESMRAKLGNELEALGSVNMRSIETYDSVREEFDETKDKLETLKTERQSIFDFMEEVEQKKRNTFNAAFDFVKENFESIYNDLAGGEGTLILDNPRDISESGLIIKAAPKGKKMINIDSLSGGEKVLTSSSFLLALQRYKPSYFYILDEMDAALDRNNSVRLAEMLRKSAGQFLLISHNDEVIKNAESVIGVSMNQGISQIVGVKLT